LTPVLCEGVKKDPSPSRGEIVDPSGWDVDPAGGDSGREDDVDEGEFIMSEYISLSRSKSR
jgi:hypothetical protein